MIAADAFWIVFRFIHIVAGVLWVGTAFAFATFVEPTVSAMGPEGGRFMAHVVEERKVFIVLSILALLTILGGIVLYAKASDGFDTDWISSGPGIGFTIGALAALAAFVIGITVIRPTGQRMQALGREIAASGGPPTPEQRSEMERVSERVKALGRTNLALILIATAAMATARYW